MLHVIHWLMSPLCVSTQLQKSREAIVTAAADIEVLYYLYRWQQRWCRSKSTCLSAGNNHIIIVLPPWPIQPLLNMYLALLKYKLQFSSILHVYHVWGSSNVCICWESISHTMNINYVYRSPKHGSMKQHNWDKWMWETPIWSQCNIPTEPQLGYVRWNSLNWRDVYRKRFSFTYDFL